MLHRYIFHFKPLSIFLNFFPPSKKRKNNNNRPNNNFSTTSAGKLVTIQATIGRLAFCFNGFLFWFSVSTRFC